jgi:hypothetical protein
MLCFNRWIKNRVIYISRISAGVWAKFWIATAVSLIVSSSDTTDSKGETRMIYNVLKRKLLGE